MTSGEFRFDKTIGTSTGAVPPSSFLPEDAKKRFTDGSDGMRGYLPGYSSILEILASRYHYVVNGCEYGNETCIPMLLRPIGWGLRLAFYLFSAIFLFLAASRDTNPINQYSFSRERTLENVLENDDTDAFEWFVGLTYVIWVVSIFSEVCTYLVGRGGGGKAPHQGQCSAFPLTLLNRVSLPGDEDGNRCFQGFILLVWFLGFGVMAATMMYAIISHMFVKRNTYFAWLFVAIVAANMLGALSDALSIGGIDGLAVQNRPASWLVSLRVIVIVPVTTVFSLFFLFLSSPPWDSIF
jgi:hypothetical protein